VRLCIPAHVLDLTFAHFRQCGGGERECQALWTSPWSRVEQIDRVVHPKHVAHAYGFQLDSDWLTSFWNELADTRRGVRVQIHTHPREAFHSKTDDAYPIIHKPGFLSLVMPDFAMGPIGFEQAYLTQLQPDGSWRQVPIADHLEVV
jgi:hypothetical protein